MNAFERFTASERIQFRKETNSKKLDEAIETYIRAFEDERDRGISKDDMRDLVNNIAGLFYAKWEMD